MARLGLLLCCIGPAGLLLAAAPVCDGVSPVDNTTLRGITVASGLTGEPLQVTAPPGDVERIFIVEQDGYIRSLQRGAGPTGHTLFLDISAQVSTAGNERGLLGLAFDPDFATNGYFYVNYTEDATRDTIVSRFTLDAVDPSIGDPGSETILLRFAQPENNHNGGHIAFGDDGFLYIGSGDGGGAGDQHGTCGNGQDTSNLLGTILRIDPGGNAPGSPDCSIAPAGPYTIPADNPLNDGPGGDCDEIWAWGLRNPWGWSFDAITGDMYIGEVGQDCWEEINYVAQADLGGQNFGWRQMEALHCFNPLMDCDPPGLSCGTSPPCGDPSLTLPILEYANTGPVCAVTGGYVYRGCRMPEFDGIYFYGDYCEGVLRSIRVVGGVATDPQSWSSQVDPGGTLVYGMTGFGTDAQGEIYLVDRAPGSVLKIVPPFPELEVSGPGAADVFRLGRAGNWSWEDLAYSTMYPTDYYSVYRGAPNGAFSCIHSTQTTGWATGDTTMPASGQLLAYLVTAHSGGEESDAGSPPRTLTNPCAAP